MEHAKLSPSAAHRWLRCPGSIRLCEGLEDPGTSYSDEGNLAHDIAAMALRLELPRSDDAFHEMCFRSKPATDGRLAPISRNGSVDPQKLKELLDSVQTYLNYVRELFADADEAFFEQRVDFSPWSAPGQFGTVDYCALVGHTLHVVDYKHGVGVMVDVEGNEQAMCYALGAYDELAFLYDIHDVKLHIVQPRGYGSPEPVSTATMTLDELLEWGENTLKPGAEAALDPAAPLVPSPKACQFCPGAGGCPSLADRTFEATAKNVTAIRKELKLYEADRLTAEQLGYVLRYRDEIRKFLKAAEDRAYRMLESGVPVPGQKLVAGKRGARKWESEERAVTALRALAKRKRLQVSEIEKRTIISPTQAEKLFGAELYEDHLADNVNQPDGKPVIAPAEDPKPALENLTGGFEDQSKES